MTLSDWMDVPENAEWYNKNIKNNKKMQHFFDVIQDELSFETRPPEMISGEMALTLHGRNVGAQRTLKMIRTAAVATQVTEGVYANYQMEQSLESMGYTPEQAKQLVGKYTEDM